MANETFLLVDNENNAYKKQGGKVSYSSQRSAKAARTRLIREGALKPEYQVKSYADWVRDDVEVEVISLMSKKAVKIRKSERGGPCDPSTERYWSM